MIGFLIKTKWTIAMQEVIALNSGQEKAEPPAEAEGVRLMKKER